MVWSTHEINQHRTQVRKQVTIFRTPQRFIFDIQKLLENGYWNKKLGGIHPHSILQIIILRMI